MRWHLPSRSMAWTLCGLSTAEVASWRGSRRVLPCRVLERHDGRHKALLEGFRGRLAGLGGLVEGGELVDQGPVRKSTMSRMRDNFIYALATT